MKKRWLLLTAAVMLTGCGSAENASESSELTTEPETEVSTEEETLPVNPKLSFELDQKQISFKLDDADMQTITTSEVLTENDIIITDWDFDGLSEVFIADFPSGLRGTYYRLDGDMQKLEKWDALNFDDGGNGIFEINGNGELVLTVGNLYGSETTTYEWSGKELKPTLYRDFYIDLANDVSDFYRFDANGEKILFQRELYESNTNECFERIIDPIYFRVFDDHIDIMRAEDCIQKIEDVKLAAAVDKLYAAHEDGSVDSPEFIESPVLPPEKYLDTYDYDSDGFDDLFVPDELLDDILGRFFRYDPDEDQYVPWDELTEIGGFIYPDYSSNVLCASIKDGDNYRFEYYRFVDGKLEQIEENG